MDTRIITRKLYNESLGCSIAMTELVRQYGELSVEDRNTWVYSMTGIEATALGMRLNQMADGLSSIFMQLNGLNVDAANDLIVVTKERSLADDSDMIAGMSTEEIAVLRAAVALQRAELSNSK